MSKKQARKGATSPRSKGKSPVSALPVVRDILLFANTLVNLLKFFS